MKISFIAAIALGGALLSTAPAAFAGSSMGYHSGSSYSFGSVGDTADCPPGTNRAGDGTCLMSSDSTLVGGASYSSSSHSSRTYSGSTSSSYMPSTSYSSSSYSSSSNCPTGSSRTSDGICMAQGGSASSMGSSTYSSYSSSTPLNSYHGQSSYVMDNRISSTMSDSEADYRYGSGSISETYTDGSNTIVPFTTTSASLSNHRVAGMGANEFLSPTNCPVSVYNPGGAKVLGCYQVSKPAPRRVIAPSYHYVQVIRPVIYVRYPVPVAVPTCRSTNWYSRYGKNWPRGGCR